MKEEAKVRLTEKRWGPDSPAPAPSAPKPAQRAPIRNSAPRTPERRPERQPERRPEPRPEPQRSSISPPELQRLHQRLIGLPGLCGKAWRDISKVVRREHRVLVNGTGQEAFAQRTKGHKSYAQFLQ